MVVPWWNERGKMKVMVVRGGEGKNERKKIIKMRGRLWFMSWWRIRD